MLYFKFKDFQEFKELCGLYTMDNGVENRRNKILLQCMKDRKFFRNCIKEDFNGVPLDLTSFASVERWVYLQLKLYAEDGCYNLCDLDNGIILPSLECHTDNNRGLCADEDVKCIRFRRDDDSLHKIKAGKFFKRCVNDTPLGEILPEQLQRQMEEVFTRNWIAHTESKFNPGYTLHVGDDVDDFKKIYSSRYCHGNFGSCMVDDDQHYFYADAVDAKAAWIENDNNEIVARCVIFTDVYDSDGEQYRLGERQYSSNGDENLKQMLVNKLILAGEIDGYKKVGVDCHNATAYVANDGTPLFDKRFHISCNLEDGDTLSYQDSFKWYDLDSHTAFNYNDANAAYELNTTDGEFCSRDRNWSTYNDCYIDEDDSYYDDVRCDYFYSHQVVYVDSRGGYYYEGDCIRCDKCHEWVHENDVIISAITGRELLL